MPPFDDVLPRLLPPTFGNVSSGRKGTQIAVLMSGGVDSSVTAMLLRDAGWDAVGITMKIPVVDACSIRRPCCGTEAALVCKDLGLPHYFVDTDEAFRAFVIDPFRKSYGEGNTPSPCVDCNTHLKFHLVWDLLRERLGIEHLATGHYARIDLAQNETRGYPNTAAPVEIAVRATRTVIPAQAGIQETRRSSRRPPLDSRLRGNDGAGAASGISGFGIASRLKAEGCRLKEDSSSAAYSLLPTAYSLLRRARDSARDQSYFLYGVPRDRLAFLHFPLGGLTKNEVRQAASACRIFVAGKPDSMELCFAAQGDYRALLRDMPSRPGPIRDAAGKRLGEHTGLHNFTVGQRRGLRISNPEPLYVIKLVPEDNAVIVGPRTAGYETRVRAVHVNVLQPAKLSVGESLRGKVRSVGHPEPCVVTGIGTVCQTTTNCEDAFEVTFDPPVFAPAPGQHLVLYDADDAIVAGGVISVDKQ